MCAIARARERALRIEVDMSGAAPSTVLVVEDDSAIVELMRFTLTDAGFCVLHVSSAEEAQARLQEVLPDVIVLDWMLPAQSGLELSRVIRADSRTRRLPIIMVTAKAEEADRVEGLEHGADDYLVKPFSPRELVARVRAVLRRRAPELSREVLEVGSLKLNTATHSVTLGGQSIEMSPTEFKLLRFLMAHPSRVFTRAQLLAKVWGDYSQIEERTVDVHMRRLRCSLGSEGEAFVETVRGVGYRLSRPGSDA